jgi:hypothetical protein
LHIKKHVPFAKIYKYQFKKKWCEEAIHFSAKMSLKLLEVSLSCLHFSLMFLKEKSSLPIFCKCVEPWHYAHLLSDFFLDTFFFKLIDRLITLMCFQIWYLYILANGTCFFICKFLQKNRKTWLLLQKHEGEVKAWQGDFQ